LMLRIEMSGEKCSMIPFGIINHIQLFISCFITILYIIYNDKYLTILM
jgi:hypothetical protein